MIKTFRIVLVLLTIFGFFNIFFASMNFDDPTQLQSLAYPGSSQSVFNVNVIPLDNSTLIYPTDPNAV